MKKCDTLIQELIKFSPTILELGTPLSDKNLISDFERTHIVTLPEDFKYFISKVNGFSLGGTEVYGFGLNQPESLQAVYHREHKEVANPQLQHLVPFSPDGMGNFYCLSTNMLSSDKSSCPVVYWQSDYSYSKDDLPDIDAESFLDWIQEHLLQS